MEASGQFHTPAALPPRKNIRYPLNRRLGEPQTVWRRKKLGVEHGTVHIVGWVSHRSCLDGVEKRKNWSLNTGPSILSPCSYTNYTNAGETFRGRVSKLFVNFEEFLARVLGNFEEQNKIKESFITINNFIIINAYYNYIV